MKYLIVLAILSSLVLASCSQTVVKYQCSDGSFVDSANSCPSVSCKNDCPQLDCASCPIKTETKTVEKIVNKYQCYDGTLKNSVSDCSDPKQYMEEVKKITFDIDDARTKATEYVGEDYNIKELTKFTLSVSTLSVEVSHSN